VTQPELLREPGHLKEPEIGSQPSDLVDSSPATGPAGGLSVLCPYSPGRAIHGASQTYCRTIDARDSGHGLQRPRDFVVGRKVIGGFRSAWGAEASAIRTSILATARKQGQNLLDAVRAVAGPSPLQAVPTPT
jgi:hypothetical protein